MCAERVSPWLKVVLLVAMRNDALNVSDTGTAVRFFFFWGGFCHHWCFGRILYGFWGTLQDLRCVQQHQVVPQCLFRKNAQRHVVLADVIVAQSMKSNILNEAGNVQSRFTGPCLRMFGSLCICVCACLCVCVYSVSVYTYCICTCFGLYTAMSVSQTERECISPWKFGKYCDAYVLLFVLITEISMIMNHYLLWSWSLEWTPPSGTVLKCAHTLKTLKTLKSPRTHS